MTELKWDEYSNCYAVKELPKYRFEIYRPALNVNNVTTKGLCIALVRYGQWIAGFFKTPRPIKTLWSTHRFEPIVSGVSVYKKWCGFFFERIKNAQHPAEDKIYGTVLWEKIPYRFGVCDDFPWLDCTLVHEYQKILYFKGEYYPQDEFKYEAFTYDSFNAKVSQ